MDHIPIKTHVQYAALFSLNLFYIVHACIVQMNKCLSSFYKACYWIPCVIVIYRDLIHLILWMYIAKSNFLIVQHVQNYKILA